MGYMKTVFRYVNENGGEIAFTPANGWLLTKPDGIDTLTVSISQSQGIGQVGATVDSVNIQPRPVTLNGRIYGGSGSKKDKLLGVVRPDLSGRLYADDYYIDCRPTATPAIGADSSFAPFQFELIAPYPYWQKDASTTTVLSGQLYKFRFPWNISRAWKFAESMETVFINVQNTGQVPVPFRATFAAKGEVVNPRITNAITGEYLLLKKALQPGERVVVSIGHEGTTATSTIDGDVRGALDLYNTLSRLAVGDNLLKPEAESGGGQMEISIDFSTEIVGIAL